MSWSETMAAFLGLDELFKGHHVDQEVVVLCVRWYLRFKLSYRVEMMAERDLSLAHTIIMRWVRHYAPEFERRWNRIAWPVGSSQPAMYLRSVRPRYWLKIQVGLSC
jgi:hypothetical protein